MYSLSYQLLILKHFFLILYKCILHNEMKFAHFKYIWGYSVLTGTTSLVHSIPLIMYVYHILSLPWVGKFFHWTVLTLCSKTFLSNKTKNHVTILQLNETYGSLRRHTFTIFSITCSIRENLHIYLRAFIDNHRYGKWDSVQLNPAQLNNIV